MTRMIGITALMTSGWLIGQCWPVMRPDHLLFGLCGFGLSFVGGALVGFATRRAA